MSDSGLEKFILDKLEKLGDKLDQVRDESGKLTSALQSQDKRDEEITREVRDMSDRFCSQLEAQQQELQQYNKHLEEHMKRSNELEKSHKKMWEKVEPVVKAHNDNAAVQQYFSNRTKRNLKIIAAIGTIVGTITAIAKLTGMF